MSLMSKEARMKKLGEEVSKCQLCGLCEGRQNPVLGEGSLDATVIFIGEAPGRKEDEMGRPFVGSAGRVLDRLLDHIGLGREHVYIGNVVKCRPPNNRRPRSKEVEACSPHLERQLEIIEPGIVAPMGNSAIRHLMKRFGLNPSPIGKIHGKLCEVEAPWGRAILFPMYHPAAAIYRRKLERVLEEDFESLKRIMECGIPRT